ncbi:hypothetical protein K190097F3_28500 [Enterocloster clostridioformis]|uniref:Uncharacterized protein n=1 Tax=Enterocloster clostridioformis TaxID=1531 RepID=A0A829WCB3_9FIRM|nr:hypothetical protein Ccl03g_28840 [Enterocloster clostridioformis]
MNKQIWICMSHYNSDFLQINFGFPFQKLCNQMIETDGGNVYGYSENYQLSNKDAGVNKEP